VESNNLTVVFLKMKNAKAIAILGNHEYKPWRTPAIYRMAPFCGSTVKRIGSSMQPHCSDSRVMKENGVTFCNGPILYHFIWNLIDCGSCMLGSASYRLVKKKRAFDHE
jgi:hypothetical protein